MKYVSKGMLNKEISDNACICENTVATHIQNIIVKIGGRNRVDIANFIKERGIA
jgi:DNA-binding NarL/FixJ family response regulator